MAPATSTDLGDPERGRVLDHVLHRPDRAVDGLLRDPSGAVVGSYHGRPDGGIAPGDGDPLVLAGPGRLAYVVDGRRGWEALYERRDGVLAQLSGGPVRRPLPVPAERRRRPVTAVACGAAVLALALPAAVVAQRGPDRADAASPVPTVRLPAPSAAAFAPAATAVRRRTVRHGDTLSGIAVDAYGTTRVVPGLAAVNRIADPDRIAAGERLLLPPATSVSSPRG